MHQKKNSEKSHLSLNLQQSARWKIKNNQTFTQYYIFETKVNILHEQVLIFEQAPNDFKEHPTPTNKITDYFRNFIHRPMPKPSSPSFIPLNKISYISAALIKLKCIDINIFH